MVLIDYEVRLQDGTAVDSAAARQQPLEARLGTGELIRGVELLRVGGVAPGTAPRGPTARPATLQLQLALTRDRRP